MTLTLKKCLDLYFVEVLKPQRSDLVRPKFAADRLMEFFGAAVDVGTITRQGGRDYREKRIADGVSDSTVKREMGVLMCALRHAAEEERIAAVPALKIPKGGRPRKRWFREEEVKALMEQPMSERARNYIYLAVGTGARKTAIVTLPVKRVNLREGWIDYDDPSLPETKKRRPTVKIADWLLPLVKRMCEGKRPDDVVIGLAGPKDVRKEVKRLLRSIGINESGVSCHAFRKTAAMWALLGGADIKQVADTLGDSISTTERNYLDVFPEGTAKAVNAIKSIERT